MSYLSVYITEFLLFSLVFLFFNLKIATKILNSEKNYKITLALLVIVQIVATALLTEEVGDIRIFAGAGRSLREGISFYWIDPNHTQYPFFPFMIYLFALIIDITDFVKVFTFSFYLKLFLLPALYFISYFIYQVNSKKIKVEGRIAQLQFLACPLTYLIVLFHGQTDVVLLAFLIGSIVVWLNKRYKLTNFLLSIVLFSFSVLTKTWSIFLGLIIVKFQKSIRRSLFYFSGVLFLLLLNVYFFTKITVGSRLITILPAILKPGGPIGIWGISYLLSSQTNFVSQNKIVIFFVLFILFQAIILLRKISIWKSIMLSILSMYIIFITWGAQYLFWVLPFCFINYYFIKKWEIITYVVLASLYGFIYYFNNSFETNIFLLDSGIYLGLLLWSFIIFWFVNLARSRPIR